MRAEAAADQHVIALDRIGVVVGLHLAGDEADLADRMLRAGVMAAGQMDVDRRVERDAVLAPGSDVLGMLLGVGGCELAAGISGACDETGAHRARLGRQSERGDAVAGARDVLIRHAGDQQVLPHRQPQVAVAEIGRDQRQAAHLFDGQLPGGRDNADPVQPRLLLLVHADMRGAAEGGPRGNGAGHGAVELAAELLLGERDECLDADGVEHVFQPRLGAVGAVAVIDEDAHHRVRHHAGVLRLHQHAGVAGEIEMPGDAAEAELEPDAGFEPEAVLHRDRLEADVVGVLEHGDGPRPVEGDVELPRQAGERAVVEDVEMPFARIRPRVDQLLRVDTRGRRAGDVADVIGTRAARAQAEVLDRLDHVDRVLRLDLADLDVGARRHMRIAAAVARSEIGEPRELLRLDDPVRDAQPAHIGVLVRRHIKKSVIAPAEIVRRLGIFVRRRLPFQFLVGVEGMLLALDLLLVGELAAGGDDAVLRLQRRGVGTDRLRRSCGRGGAESSPGDGHALRSLGDLDAGDEAFEIALLLGLEVARRHGGGLEFGLAHSAGT